MLPVLIRPGRLGDVVLLGAVTGSLPCVVATEDRYAPLAARLKGVERVIPLASVRDEPGLLVDLQGSLRTRWLCRGRAHRTIHKRGLRRRLWLRTGWPDPPRPDVPHVYAEAAGVPVAPLPWIEVPDRPRTALGIAPGAAFAPKRWRPDHFSALGRQWDGPVTVFGGPGEEGLVRFVSAGIPGSRRVIEAGFTETIDALASVAVMVAGDTGLMHLAGATGARVVALFGPTHPSDGFFVYPGTALGRTLPCRPCALHRVDRCRVGHHGCMAHPVDDVLAAVRASGRSPARG
ncbi:MAG: glycosyltransferase family 9 protein [Myxococcota bacterium]